MPRAATTTDVFNAIAEERRRALLEALGGEEVGVDGVFDVDHVHAVGAVADDAELAGTGAL